MDIKVLGLKEFWDAIRRYTSDIPDSIVSLYYRVPWLRRAVDLIAYSAATFPVSFQNERGEEVEPVGAVKDIADRVHELFVDYLLYGKAGGWVLEGRTFDLTKFERIPPGALQWDVNRGAWFVVLSNGREYITHSGQDLNAIVWGSPTPDGKEPVAPAEAAKVYAWAADKIMQVTGNWFRWGAVNVPVFLMDYPPSQSQQAEIRSWWRKLIGGADKSHLPLGVGGVRKVEIVGTKPEEWGLQVVLEEARRGIAVALGVPQTMLEDAANYATAKEHRLSFYENTVKPLVDFFWDTVNRALKDLGVDVQAVLVPQDLEIYQKDESEKAAAVAQLFGLGIITLNEAREWLGWEPLPERQVQQEPAQPQRAAPVEEWGARWGAVERKAFLHDLEDWRQKIKNRKAVVDFESDVIPEPVRLRVVEAYSPEQALRYIRGWMRAKAEKPPREQFIHVEEDLKKVIYAIMQKYRDKFSKRLQKGEKFDDLVLQYTEELMSALRAEMGDVAEQALNVYEATVGIFLYPEMIDEFANGWSREYIEKRFHLIQRTTQQALEAIHNDIQGAQIPKDAVAKEIERRLARVFGEERAGRIAVTELTAAISSSSKYYADSLTAMGLQVRRRWLTQADERVCQICAPLDEKLVPDETGGKEPPAHVMCRCSVIVEVPRR